MRRTTYFNFAIINRQYIKILLGLGLTIAAILNFSFQINGSAFSPSTQLEENTLNTTESSYYVDGINGDNSFDGSSGHPFKTIQKAASIMTAGSTCYIAPGIYRETLVPKNSGTSGAAISFVAMGPGVVISAADPISSWTHISGNIYKASMKWTLNNSGVKGNEAGMDQIFVDGKMMIEARWPNLPTNVDPCEYRREFGALSNAGDYKNPQYTQTGISAIPDPTGAYINEIGATFWTPITGKIKSRSNNTIFISRPNAGEDQQYYGEAAGDYFYLWGKLDFLDSEREWFRDIETSMLYLWTPEGDNPTNHIVEAKKREYVLDLRGKSNLTFKGIETRGGGILTDKATTFLTLDGMKLEYLSHYSIITNYWVSRMVGIVLKGDNTIVKNSEIAYSAETCLLVTGNNALVTNNVIHDGAYLGTDGFVFGINYSKNSTVSNNTLFGCGTNGVLDIRYSPANQILNNDVFYGSRITCDGGMIMTCRNFNGMDTRVAYNFIHDGLGILDYKKWRFGTTGFYAEKDANGTGGYTVDHNIIAGVNFYGIAFPAGDGFKVNNNTCAGTAISFGDHDTGPIVYTNSEAKNNIAASFYKSTTEVSVSNILSNNIQTDVSKLVFPNNYKIADVGFVDAKNYNFSLKANSLAIDKGDSTAANVGSFNGIAPDAGALEYGKPAFVSGAVISDNDIPNLIISFNSETKTYTISNNPKGRYLPENFKLKVGNNAAGGNVTMNYKAKTWTVTGVETTNGGQVYGQIGENTPVAMKLITETGMKKVNTEESSFEFYPNPAFDHVSVELRHDISPKNIVLLIYDMQGKAVLSQTTQQLKTELDIAHLAPGIYSLKLINRNNSEVKHLVKM